MNEKILSIVIKATDQASKTIQAVGASVDVASNKLSTMGDSLESAGKKMSSLGGELTSTFTLPVVGVGAASIKMAMDFQQAMTYVRTDAGDTTDDINQLSQSVLQLAKTSQFSPDELANGLYHLASLGLRGADALNALNTAQQMASVGGADLESTASALGAALVTGIKGVQDYSQAAGTLDAIIGSGNMRMQDLVNSLGTGVLTVFKNAGLTLTDYGAALATLTDNGMDAAEAATRLRMTISLMTAPSGPAVDALNAIGMAANQLGMDMQTKGLIPALEDLQKHLLDTYGTTAEGKVKIEQALADMFGGGRSSAAIITLLDQLDRVNNKESQIAGQSGEFANKVAEQQQTAAAKFKTAWSSVQANLIELGDQLLPLVAKWMGELVNKISELQKWWSSLSSWQQTVIKDFIVFAATAGPVLVVLGKLTTGVGALVKVGGGTIGLFSKIFNATAVRSVAAMSGSIAGAAAESGGLAALLTGPVGLALAGTVLAAGGAYLAYKHFADGNVEAANSSDAMNQKVKDFQNLASNLNVQLPQTAGSVSMLTLSQMNHKEAQEMVNNATAMGIQNSKDYKAAQDDVKKAADNVVTAQNNVKGALDQYGQNSPQYINAVQQLHDAQWNYNQELNNEIGDSLNAMIYEGKLAKSKEVLASATSNLSGWMDYLNGKIGETISLVGAQLKQAIDLQAIPAVGRLQGAVQAVQKQAGSVIQLTGGLGGASSSFNLQGARGFASGGYTGAGSDGEVAGIVHKGEYVLPKSQVDQSTGLPKNSGTTFNMFGNINLGSADAVDRFFQRLNSQREMSALGVGV